MLVKKSISIYMYLENVSTFSMQVRRWMGGLRPFQDDQDQGGETGHWRIWVPGGSSTKSQELFWPSDFYAGKEKYHKAMFKSRFPSRYLMVVEHWQWHDIKFHEYSRKRKLEYLNRHNLVVEGAQTLCGRTSEAEKHDRRPSQVHVSSHITHSKFSYKPFLKVHWPDPRARTVPLQCLQRPQETVDGCENQQIVTLLRYNDFLSKSGSFPSPFKS